MSGTILNEIAFQSRQQQIARSSGRLSLDHQQLTVLSLACQ